jgi:hypothetical protein
VYEVLSSSFSESSAKAATENCEAKTKASNAVAAVFAIDIFAFSVAVRIFEVHF